MKLGLVFAFRLQDGAVSAVVVLDGRPVMETTCTGAMAEIRARALAWAACFSLPNAPVGAARIDIPTTEPKGRA